ncbi:VQ motif-containing protein 25-like [Nymphaea colorata]|uniref:VQ domain-containing protein n=1 Tax=Nymphaea colorata TaxID=210225 RepID=A0A5K0V6X0_9MAGN|nr:VQ motif-containing protein 25-like [Nymphaea colorata]
MDDELSRRRDPGGDRPSTMLGACRDSHTITKPRTGGATTTKLPSPAVRIIHVFSPEIIKTDPANFRELVQKLTGKPTPATSKSTRKSAKKQQQSDITSDGPSSSSSPAAVEAETVAAKAVKEEEEEEISWRIDSSSFEQDLGDIDSFVARLLHMGSSDFSESSLFPIETDHHLF